MIMIIMFKKSNNERKGSAIAPVKLPPPHPHYVDYPKVESRVEYTIRRLLGVDSNKSPPVHGLRLCYVQLDLECDIVKGHVVP